MLSKASVISSHYLLRMPGMTACPVALFSSTPLGSRRKERLKERSQRYQAKFADDPDKPSLQVLLRSLYIRAHPDVIRHSQRESFSVFFREIGVLQGKDFRWDKEYFPEVEKSDEH